MCDLVSFTMKELERFYCIHDHHVYGEIWKAAVCKVLSWEREARNTHDRYAVAVKMTGTTDIIGHLPTLLDTSVALMIYCRKYFVSLVFVAVEAYKNILTMKISQFMVCCTMYPCKCNSRFICTEPEGLTVRFTLGFWIKPDQIVLIQHAV